MRPTRLGIALALLAALGVAACSDAQPKIKTPARVTYYEAQALADQELYAEAVTKFQEVADQNPGTQLGAFANLRIAEIRAQQRDWVKAQTSYRLFLNSNQASHLTPYVIYRLIRVNYEASYTGLFFREREIDRDMEPNRQIIQEYKRFFFLYPKSIFLDEVRRYAQAAEETLADHERLVADFYFRREHFRAAAARYLYLLRNYPQYPESDAVLGRLVESYRRSQQPELAAEMERLRSGKAIEGDVELEGEPGGSAAAPTTAPTTVPAAVAPAAAPAAPPATPASG